MIIDTLGQPIKDKEINKLSLINIIDVGTITNYKRSDNKADVSLYRLDTNGSRILLHDVEVILPGSISNGFQHEITNAPCLVFYPRSVVPSLQNGYIMNRADWYSEQGAKCLPFSVMPSSDLSVGFDGFGNFAIGNEKYCFQFTKNGVTYQNADGGIQLGLGDSKSISTVIGGGRIHRNVLEDGTYELYFLTQDDKTAFRLLYKAEDGSYKIQRAGFDAWDTTQDIDTNKYAWETSWALDGSLDIKQQSNSEKVLNQVTISSDGNIVISQPEAGNTITIKQDGTITVASSGQMSLEGQGASFSGGDGKISLKNNAYSVKDAFTDLIAVLDTFKTQGSPGSHTAVPMQFETLKQKLSTLWE